MSKKVLKNRIIKAILFILLGVLYLLVVNALGYGIPCLFHLVTGLFCPGCGVTRMLVAMIHLDFKEAFLSNQALFILQPVIYYFVLKQIYFYLTQGKVIYSKFERFLICFSIVLLLLYAIYRNIFLLCF